MSQNERLLPDTATCHATEFIKQLQHHLAAAQPVKTARHGVQTIFIQPELRN
ncbi:unnamed protein product, partial [Ceratitis capitata]